MEKRKPYGYVFIRYSKRYKLILSPNWMIPACLLRVSQSCSSANSPLLRGETSGSTPLQGVPVGLSAVRGALPVLLRARGVGGAVGVSVVGGVVSAVGVSVVGGVVGGVVGALGGSVVGLCIVRGRAQRRAVSGATRRRWQRRGRGRRRSLCTTRLGHRRALFGLAASLLPWAAAVFQLRSDILAALRRFGLTLSLIHI